MSEVEQLTFEFAQRPTIKGFPELRWTGKRPYKSTQYYPAQLRETYGEDQNGWMNKIFWGDNLQVMSHLLKEYRGQIDLIYIVILTPILMSILSSENAQRFNQSKTYFTLDLLIGWHSTLLRVSRP